MVVLENNGAEFWLSVLALVTLITLIVRLMEAQGYLTAEQTIQALANPAILSSAAAARAGGAFADWVMERGGEDGFLDLLKAADIEIETTFDPKIQRMAEEALASVFENKVRKGSQAQAAIVVMTHDGAVRAMVGGRERGAAQFNRATQALRQTGSAFKPIVYAAGLESGLSPLDRHALPGRRALFYWDGRRGGPHPYSRRYRHWERAAGSGNGKDPKGVL